MTVYEHVFDGFLWLKYFCLQLINQHDHTVHDVHIDTCKVLFWFVFPLIFLCGFFDTMKMKIDWQIGLHLTSNRYLKLCVCYNWFFSSYFFFAVTLFPLLPPPSSLSLCVYPLSKQFLFSSHWLPFECALFFCMLFWCLLYLLKGPLCFRFH